MTSTPATIVTETSPPERASKASLYQFIDEHSKLVTAIAAFVALTAFSSQLNNSDIKPLFPALTFLAAALLGFELLAKLPDRPREWRLEIFSMIFAVLVMMMGWYWFAAFPAVWGPALFVLLEVVVFIGIAALLTYILVWIIGLVMVKLFKREMRANVKLRISQILFVSCAFFVVFGLVRASTMFAGRSITIHLPKVTGS